MMPRASRAAFILGSFAISTSGAAAQECKEFGKPSYVATRIVDIGGQKISSKVFLADDKEREDLKAGDRTIVRLRVGRSMTVFDDVSKTGKSTVVGAPGPSPVKKGDPNVRDTKEKSGDTQVNTIQIKDGDKWIDLIKVTCRLDGVVLEKEFPVDLQGKPGRAKLRHSDIELKELPADTFEVPKGIKIETK